MLPLAYTALEPEHSNRTTKHRLKSRTQKRVASS
jgi:hypothetical protein